MPQVCHATSSVMLHLAVPSFQVSGEAEDRGELCWFIWSICFRPTWNFDNKGYKRKEI